MASPCMIRHLVIAGLLTFTFTFIPALQVLAMGDKRGEPYAR